MTRTQVLSAATALLFVATAAQAQRGTDDHRGRQDPRQQVSRPVQPRPNDHNLESPLQRARTAGTPNLANQRRTAPYEAPQRDLRTRQREQDLEVERAQRLAEQNRLLQARRIEEQNRLIEAQRLAQLNRAYDRDRYYRPGFDYRYNMGGVYRETNQYGADVLRQAIDVGYQQGYRAGQLDARDRVAPDYRRAFEYQNGTYGYTSNYVPQSDYSYYFREGFQRGYDDAYGNQARYGTFSNGTASILGTIAAGILGLTLIH